MSSKRVVIVDRDGGPPRIAGVIDKPYPLALSENNGWTEVHLYRETYRALYYRAPLVPLNRFNQTFDPRQV